MGERDTSGSSGNDAPAQRIVLVNQYYPPATAPTAKLMADVASTLAAGGHEVQVIASRRGYRNAADRFPRRELIDGVHVRRVGGTGFNQAKRSGRIANYLAFFVSAGRQLLVTRKPDVVVSLSTPPLLAVVVQAAASLRGSRFVYWVMDVYPELAFRLGHLKRSSITGRLFDWFGRRVLGRADAVIALGDDMAQRLEPHSNGHTTVVRTWADGDHIRPFNGTEHPARRKWGWDGKFVVAYSGTMGLVHEFDTILDAAADLKGDDRYLFCFIGGGARVAEVRTQAQQRSLHNIEFRGYVPDVDLPTSLTAPDLHVVSLREDLAGLSVPSKTYSVLAAGKPVVFIGPDGSDIKRIVVDNRCGVHIRNAEPGALVRAIRAYAESDELVAAHASAARATYESGFTRGDMIAHLSFTILA